MARALKVYCGCGYEKTLYVGEGRLAIDENYIRCSFSAEELAEFEQALAKKDCNFSFYQKAARCKKCDDIVSAGVLRYSVSGNMKFIYKPCADCGGEVTPIDGDSLPCPKCKNTLQTANTDELWD